MIKGFKGEYGRLNSMLEAFWQYTGILKARFYYAEGEKFYSADAMKKDFARTKNQARKEYKTIQKDLDKRERDKRRERRKRREE